MALRSLNRTTPALTLAACLVATAGCSIAGAVADGLLDDSPPPPGMRDVGEASRGSDGGTAAAGTSSVYLASPALTWGSLQLHRPHTIGGSLFEPGSHFAPECRRTARLPFEATGLRFSDPWTVLGFERPGGIPGADAPVELPFSFDREIVAERMMRSGAYLVDRGPVCFQSFFVGIRLGDAAGGSLSYW